MNLIIGIGNTLRNDDGIGALIVSQIKKENWSDVEIKIAHQLHLEDVENFLAYQKIIVVDASCNQDNRGDYHLEKIDSSFSVALSSSHHLSLQMLVELARRLYNKEIHLFLCSIRGLNFDIGETISPSVLLSVPKAIELIANEIAM